MIAKLAIASFILLAGISYAVSNNPDFAKDVHSIEQTRFKSESALHQFKRNIAALDNKWQSAASSDRAELFLRAADAARSSYFEGEDSYEQYVLEQDYALKGLERALSEPLPLVTEMRLVMHLRMDLSKQSPSSQEFGQERRIKSQFWSHAWQRVEIEAAQVFTEADKPLNYVLPPTGKDGTQLPPGVSPEAIAEPSLRKQYQDAIDENHLKAERAIQHTAVLNLRKSFEKEAENFFLQSYSEGPLNLEELNNLLSVVTDYNAKNRIISTVQSERQ
jgi:hypothetical protein